MIKINLLGEGRPRVSKPKKAAAAASVTGEPAVLWLLILLAVGLLLIAGQYFRLQSTIDQKAEEIARVQQEVNELKPIIEEVEQFEARKAELEHKISVINTLKENQRGPVRIMDEVSRALPEMLWLTRMTAQGSNITLQGQAFNTNAVANFIDNLDQVDAFNEPVLRDTAQRRSRGAAPEVFNFSISFGFDPSAVKTATPEPDAEAAG
jgi:type IV pilus assembly protein PilN